ncbi:MAG: hypothetical protein HYX33_02120 [Actinobacteria bacterium]|nr:hypothetical protein [Actinomycetota bacterium]
MGALVLGALVVGGLTIAAFSDSRVGRATAESASAECSPEYRVDRTLPNGARWSLCWELRAAEGVVLDNVTFTPPGGVARRVLGRGSLAQIYVPYDDNGARFHDVSDYGLGANASTYAPSDCPNGDLMSANGSAVVCVLTETSAPTFRYRTTQRFGERLVLMSSAQVGAYNYTMRWAFSEDGSIEPGVGASGRLQRVSTDTRLPGWEIAPAASPRLAVSHTHSYFWRLDFDVDGPANDRVEEFEFARSEDGTQRSFTRTPFTTETARRVNQEGFRTWRVFDTASANANGGAISYELTPNASEVFRGTAGEGFTQNDLYVTTNRACERFASRNPTLGGCGEQLPDFVNGEPLAGEDIVLWYGVSAHHLPTSEDDPAMATHWTSFQIRPRDGAATSVPTAGGAVDDLSSAQRVASLPFRASVDARGFTRAPDDPAAPCASGPPGATAWFTYTPSLDGTLSATTAGSTGDTVLAVYSGRRGALTPVACSDDADGGSQSRVDVAVRAGVTYALMVGAVGAPGDVLLDISPVLPAQAPTPGPTVPVTPRTPSGTPTVRSGAKKKTAGKRVAGVRRSRGRAK